LNLIDISRKYSNDEDCFKFLEERRWKGGVVRCVTCGNDRISRITRKSPSKNKRAQIFQCLEKTCKQQFSCTSGTVFHDTRLPIHLWFMAVELVMDAKKGMSAVQIQRHLGIRSYQTAWHMVHRIREAMAGTDSTPLKGTVEIDETYIGGTSVRRFRKHPKPRPPKEIVLAMRERSTKEKDGRVRYFHVLDTKAETLRPIIKANLQEFPSRVITDTSASYEAVFKDKIGRKAHRMINHSQEWVVPGTNFHTNTVESSFSLLKRGLIGSFHRVSTKHLQRYLNEFEYRFNCRNSPVQFATCVADMCATKPLTFRSLVGQPDLPF
jgi:transposase-like protein